MQPAPRSSTAAPTLVDHEILAREDPRKREQLSEPAISAFFSIAARWGLTIAEMQGLLGWVSESTVHKYKNAGSVGTLSYDILTRISLCLGIYKALQMLFAEPELADRWVKLPNSNALFGGRPPIQLMIHGGIDGLYQVRRLLDARVQ